MEMGCSGRGPLRHTKIVRVSLPVTVTGSCPTMLRLRKREEKGESFSFYVRKRVQRGGLGFKRVSS